MSETQSFVVSNGHTGHGLGDTIVGIYAATGICRQTGVPTELRVRGHEWVIPVVAEPNLTISPYSEGGSQFAGDDKYHTEMVEDHLRARYYCQGIGDYYPEVPEINSPPENPLQDKGNYAILAPFSAWSSRNWNITHWRRLAILLQNNGFQPVVIGGAAQKDQIAEYFGGISGVTWYWGMSPHWVWAAIAHSKGLIGVDSGPVHFSGLIRQKTVSIHAHLSPEHLYSHCPYITSAYPINEPCVGCRWQPSRTYNGLCDAGCSALTSVSAATVLKLFLQIQG